MIIDGKAVAAKVRADVAQAVKDIQAKAGVTPGLALIRVGNDPASEVYVRGKVKACQETGMAGSEHILPESTSQADLLALVHKLNADPRVHGVLVQLPLPKQISADVVLDALAPQKDVDGFGPLNAGALFTGRPGLRPCTPLGILRLLDEAKTPLSGARALVVGRSNIVGKPVAMLLINANATVTVKATFATAGNYTATATVSSTTTDLYTSNNAFTITVPVQSVVCATPGKDGTPGAAITGVVNTYYPGTASAASGATSITVGAPTGSATVIANGDLLLVMQMQDAAINTTNGATYGDGSGAGSGWTNLNSAGAYEYVRATSAVVANVVSIAGAGPTAGLIYSYSNAAASATQGQRRFQVIRVPQYASATLGAALTANAWNGTTGGVLAIDVENTLTLAGQTITVTGLGFRGGAALQLNGVTAGSANTDFVFPAPAAYAPPGANVNGWHGSKGEGIAGTPMFVQSAGSFLATGSTYPSGAAADGSMGRGAPGNAGGGGTDGGSGGNVNNSGGGGGANGGIGGAGGAAPVGSGRSRAKPRGPYMSE